MYEQIKDDGLDETVQDNEIELAVYDEKEHDARAVTMVTDHDDKTKYKKLEEPEQEEESDIIVKNEAAKISNFNRFKGFILVAMAGVIYSVVAAVAKYLKHIPVAHYMFMQFVLTLMIILPLLCFFQPRIEFCGKARWILIRCAVGGIAGVIKFLSYIKMDLGDAMAMFATAPLFAGLFARILLKEKINIFTLISAVLGISGIILIAKPSFLFGNADKGYSWFTLVTIFGAMCLGFAYTTLRIIGGAVHYLVIPLVQMVTMTSYAVALFFAKTEEHVAPGCFEDRIIMFIAAGAIVCALAFVNRGMAIERTGPITLVRNLDTVYAYIIQITFFKKDPEMLSFIGAALILLGTLLITLNKLFLRKYKFCEF